MSADDPRAEPFAEPRLAINRVYTRRGDSGQTSLVSGDRVSKDSLRVEVYGAVDELCAHVGLTRILARAHPRGAALASWLETLQHTLFNLGSLLATRPDAVGVLQARVTDADVERLEREIDAKNALLPELRSFVLPGASVIGAQLHVCRTVCRRAERLAVRLQREEPQSDVLVVRYLNRLSDALFVAARHADLIVERATELLWDPNLASP